MGDQSIDVVKSYKTMPHKNTTLHRSIMNRRVCIVCMAKREENYILEFIHYHLCLGFDKIILYDNEDSPTYQDLIAQKRPSFLPFVQIIHFPNKPYSKGILYVALDHFMQNFMKEYTHAIHMDVDEFIVLKKHPDIKSFIQEWIDADPTCAGVGFNWKMFGASDHPSPFLEDGGSGDFSLVLRFLKCQSGLNRHIKTLFRTDRMGGYRTVHDIHPTPGCHVKSADTSRHIIKGPFHHTSDDSVSQLNHYKTKTWPEFKTIWSRGAADHPRSSQFNTLRTDENISAMRHAFDKHNMNDCVDTTARDFYLRMLEHTPNQDSCLHSCPSCP